MSSTFRASTPADAASIASLMRDVFGMPADHPGIQRAQMDWKYWQPYESWEASRSYVLEREGDVVAHGAVIPLRLVWGERRLRLISLIDWAARRDRPGAGITILQRIARTADGVFTAGGSEEAQRVTPAFGFRQSAPARRFARPLRPLARLRRDGFGSWKPAARFVRDVAWRLRAPVGAPGGWSAVKLIAGDIPAWLQAMTPASGVAYFERTAADVTHLLGCPVTPGAFYRVERHGAPAGYFVLTQALAQCRIGEAWVNPSAAEDWLALYRLAMHAALRDSSAIEIAVAASTGPETAALLEAGFRDCGEVSLRFLLPDRTAPEAVRYQLVDADGAYLHDGHGWFWT